MPRGGPSVSFEFFPPRSLEASFRLWETVKALAPLGPRVRLRHLRRRRRRPASSPTRRSRAIHKTTRAETSRAPDLRRRDARRDPGHCRGPTPRPAVGARSWPCGGDPPKGAGAFTPHPRRLRRQLRAEIEALGIDGTLQACAWGSLSGAPSRSRLRHGRHRMAQSASGRCRRRFGDHEPSSSSEAKTLPSASAMAWGVAGGRIDKPVIPGVLPGCENWGGTRRLRTAACGTGIPPHIAAAFEAAARDGSLPASLATRSWRRSCARSSSKAVFPRTSISIRSTVRN